MKGPFLGQSLGYPPADRIRSAGQVERIVRVKALHASSRSAHPAPRLRPWMEDASPPRVFLVSAAQRGTKVGVDLSPFVKALDPALGLQAGYCLDRFRARQPEQRGKWIAMRIHRAVADGQGVTDAAASYHREGNQRFPP